MILPETITTLSQARVYLQENYEEGVGCPCCKQHVKLYKRKLNSAMAIALIEIYNASKYNGFDFIHVEDHFKEMPGLPSSIRGDFPKLRHWGLIEALKEKREDGSKRNGMYRITGRGIAFVQCNLRVASHVHLFNNEVKGFSDNHVGIAACLGSKFNYDELMGN
jgi:hypothetical protein